MSLLLSYCAIQIKKYEFSSEMPPQLGVELKIQDDRSKLKR